MLTNRELRVRQEAAMTDPEWSAYRESFKGSSRPLSKWSDEQWAGRLRLVKAKVLVWDGAIDKMTKPELYQLSKDLDIKGLSSASKTQLLSVLRSV